MHRLLRGLPLLAGLLLCSTLAYSGGPYYDSNGNNPYAPPSIVYGPTQGYPSGTVPHVICDSGCTAGAGTPSTAINDGTSTSTKATVDGSGNLQVKLGAAVPAGANVIGHVIADTGSTTAVTGTVSANTAQVNGVTTSTGTGAVGTGSQRIAVGTDTATIAGSAPGTAGTASANVVTVQGVASMTKLLVTPDSVALPANQSVNEAQINGVAPTMGNGASGTGVQRVTLASDSTGIVQTVPGTAGGLLMLTKQVAANTTSFAVDASAGQLYGVEAFNNGTTIAYIKLYNASQGSTTCGSGTPVYRGMIPAPSSGGGGYIAMNAQGMAFSTAITACVTAGYADNDTTNPAATTYIVNFYYK